MYKIIFTNSTRMASSFVVTAFHQKLQKTTSMIISKVNVPKPQFSMK